MDPAGSYKEPYGANNNQILFEYFDEKLWTNQRNKHSDMSLTWNFFKEVTEFFLVLMLYLPHYTSEVLPLYLYFKLSL